MHAVLRGFGGSVGERKRAGEGDAGFVIAAKRIRNAPRTPK